MRTCNFRRTDEECWHCEEDTYIQRGHERFCPTCFHAPDGYPKEAEGHVDEWRAFWEHRETYEGYYGEDRQKGVGGFASIHFED